MDQQQMNVNIDLKNTESVEHKNGKVWAQGFIIRKVSKFVAGTAEDAYMPNPVLKLLTPLFKLKEYDKQIYFLN